MILKRVVCVSPVHAVCSWDLNGGFMGMLSNRKAPAMCTFKMPSAAPDEAWWPDGYLHHRRSMS